MLRDARNVLFSESNPFTELVTYIDECGVEKPDVRVIVHRGGVGEKDRSNRTDGWGVRTEVQINPADVGQIIPLSHKIKMFCPEKNETRTYKITGIIGRTPFVWRVGVSL